MKKTDTTNETDQMNLSEVVDRAAVELLDGRSLDLDALCQGNPHVREQLEAVLPTIMAMADFGELSGSSSQQRKSDEFRTATDNLIGTLGDFRILRELGRGGMGIVYEAEQISLGRLIALKVLPFAALLDSRQLQRFKNEARAAAMLKHPGIVSVHSVGCERGVHYYAMELIDGPSLSEVIQRIHRQDSPQKVQPRPEDIARPSHADIDTKSVANMRTQYSSNRPAFYRSVAELGTQAANALDYAHQCDIIHRDIKPSNLLLDNDGRLHIADFGLARIQTGDDLTMSGDMLGTLRYMSPEQVERGQDVDRRVDIYSLGLTLYELIEGEPAFSGTSRHEITSEILERTPVFSASVRRSLPHDLETIVGKAIDKDADCRYATAADMAADLQRFIDERPITARRTSGLERTRRWMKRNRALATALATVFVLLLMLAAGSTSVAWRLSTEASQHRSAIYARDIRLAQNGLEHGDRLAVEKTLLSWVPKDGSEDLRDFEWFYLWNACHNPAIERTISHSLYSYAVEFASDDGTLLASGWWNPNIDLWDWQDRDMNNPTRRLRQSVMGIMELLRVPEKNWLVSGDTDGNVVVWNLVSGERVESLKLEAPESNNHVNNVSFSTDFRFLAVSAGERDDSYVHVWDRLEKSWIAKIVDRPGQCHSLFVDDDRLVVVAKKSPNLEVWRVSTSSLEATHALNADGATAIAVSAKRRELAVGTATFIDRRTVGSVEFWDIDTWTRKKQGSVRSGRVRSMDYSMDGKFLAIGGDDRSLTLANFDASKIQVFEGMHAGTIFSVAFSPDNQYLATASQDKQVHIWNVSKLLRNPSPSRVPLKTDSKQTLSMKFADHGSLVCGTQIGGNVNLWDTDDGRIQSSFDVGWFGSMCQVEVDQDRSLAAVSCGHWPRKRGTPGEVVLWDLVGDKLHSRYEISNGIFYSESAFSPCGRYVAVCSWNDVVVIDIESRRIHRQIGLGGPIKSVDFSADGRWLACGNMYGGVIHLLDTDGFDEKREAIVADDVGVTYVAFSPDSQWLAAGGFDRRLKLIDVSTGDVIKSFGELPSYIVSIDFLPNGRRVAAASADGEIRVYDTKTGEDLLRFDFPNAGYPTARFSRDGSSLLLADYKIADVIHADKSQHLSNLSVVELNEISCRNFVDYKWKPGDK